MEAHTGGTAALAAVRHAAQDARFHTGAQVGRIVQRHFGKSTVCRVLGRAGKRLHHAGRHQQLRVAALPPGHPLEKRGAVAPGQHLTRLFAYLWRVGADPDVVDLRTSAPEGEVLTEISGAVHHGPGDSEVDVDLAPGDIFEDALVRCRFAANVMVLGKTIHKNGDPEPGN